MYICLYHNHDFASFQLWLSNAINMDIWVYLNYCMRVVLIQLWPHFINVQFISNRPRIGFLYESWFIIICDVNLALIRLYDYICLKWTFDSFSFLYDVDSTHVDIYTLLMRDFNLVLHTCLQLSLYDFHPVYICPWLHMHISPANSLGIRIDIPSACLMIMFSMSIRIILRFLIISSQTRSNL